jgi:membrane protein DedA with SNARE-associated domain
MENLFGKHSFLAITIAILLEELGIPMPIPTDILIVFAGIEGAGNLPRLLLWFVVLNIASAIGASGLYMIVRRGGRPLVDRFGRYVHLGPAQLARSEALLQRSGWLGIAIGRSIPGLRYVTVIACGLLNVSYLRFLSAHTVGSSVYIAIFLALGALFGKPILEQIHAPGLLLRLCWQLALAVGLPGLFMWLCYRAHAEHPLPPSRWRVVSAMVVASFAGAAALAASWAFAGNLVQLFGISADHLDITVLLVRWLSGHGWRDAGSHMLVYLTLIMACIAIGVIFFDLLLPWIAPESKSLTHQVLGLMLFTGVLVALFLAPLVQFRLVAPLYHWWHSGPWLLSLTLAFGIVSYSLTVVYGRALAILILPSLRRKPTKAAPPGTPPEEMVQAELEPEFEREDDLPDTPKTSLEAPQTSLEAPNQTT